MTIHNNKFILIYNNNKFNVIHSNNNTIILKIMIIIIN
jgi:hypothetical protein